MRTRVALTIPAALAAVVLAGCAATPDAAGPDASGQPSPVESVQEAEMDETDGDRGAHVAATEALFAAIADDDIAAAEAALADGAALEARGEGGRTPLVAATKANRVGIATLLLERGADPNAKDDLQDSAFLYAGAEGLNEILEAIVLGDGGEEHVRIVRTLLRAGADPTISDGDGTSPRALAAERGYADIVAEIDEALGK